MRFNITTSDQSLNRIPDLEFLKLNRCNIVDELANWHSLSICLHVDIRAFRLNSYESGAENVSALGLANERELEFPFVGIIIQIMAKLCIYRISLVWNVYVESGQYVLDVGLQSLDFCLVIAHLVQQVYASLVCLEVLVLQLRDVVSARLDLLLQHVLLVEQLFVLPLELSNFLHKQINVRLLLLAHLFKFSNVVRLIAAHLF